MKKNLGITRNKLSLLTHSKQQLYKKKNRFQPISQKQESVLSNQSSRVSEQLLTSTSIHSNSEQYIGSKEVYDKAKDKLKLVVEIQKKISVLSKARLSSFKEKENQKHDENISKLASEATNQLLQAQKLLKLLSQIPSVNSVQQKFLENMKKSLAVEIREVSKNLRQQEKQYFNTVRMYEKRITNNAIVLSAEQKQMMTSSEFEEMQEETNDLENKKIDDLVKSINKLSTIYKQLNSLVIEQGSLIDRIDINIESTLQHTQQGVKHLQAADEAASSPFADKVIKVLVVSILILAVFLGFKYAA